MNVNLLTKVVLTTLIFTVIIFYWWFTDKPVDGLWFFSLFGLVTVLLMIGQSAKENLENYFEKNIDKFLSILRKIGILPRPTEVGLFVMAITSVLVLTIYNLWASLYKILVEIGHPIGFLILSIFFFGLGVSIYHIFTDREKTEIEVQSMRFFMITVLIGVSILTAVFIYHEKQNGYFILSVWSALQAIILYLLSDKRWSHKTIKMPIYQATRKELYLALVIVPVTIVSAKLLDQHWIIAFSSTLIVWSYTEIFFGSRSQDQITNSD